MTRKELEQIAKKIAESLEEKPYEYWVKQKYPMDFLDEIDGVKVSVEIDKLELNDEYIQLGVIVNDGTWYKIFGHPIIPVDGGYSTVIYRKHESQREDE